MRITNVFNAVREGTYDDFKKFYNGDVNMINDNTGLNLLCLAVVNDKNPDDKINIIKFLISEGININYKDSKHNRNALHSFYFNVLRPSSKYMMQISKILISSGIDVNEADKYNAIPLKYAITITKKTTEEIKAVYRYLLEKGSNYAQQDTFGKSCIDYAKEYSWRNDFIKIVEEFSNANK